MSNNLVEFFQTTIADQLAQTTSGMLGESSASTSSAVRSIFSVLLGSMQRMGNTDQGTQELLSFINTKGIGEEVLTTVQTGLEDPTLLSGLTSSGSEILNFLLGSNLNPVVDQVSTSNGLKTSSASTLLKIIAPIVMSLVSGVVKNKNLGVSDIRTFLSDHRDAVNAVLPASIREIVSTDPDAKVAHGIIEVPAEVVPEKTGSTLSRLLPWIVLLIAALGLFYFLETGGGPVEEVPVVNSDSIRLQHIADSMSQQQMLDSLNNQRLMNADSVTAADSLR